MKSITTNAKHRVRTTGSEHQGQTSISDPDQNRGFTCIFSSGMQETSFLKAKCKNWSVWIGRQFIPFNSWEENVPPFWCSKF